MFLSLVHVTVHRYMQLAQHCPSGLKLQTELVYIVYGANYKQTIGSPQKMDLGNDYI